jgi:hypothetical protein
MQRTVIRVNVTRKEDPYKTLRREYMLTHFPNWEKHSPEGELFSGMRRFTELTEQLSRQAIAARVSISGAPWPEDDLDRLLKREPETLIEHVLDARNRKRLVCEYGHECWKQGIVNREQAHAK